MSPVTFWNWLHTQYLHLKTNIASFFPVLWIPPETPNSFCLEDAAMRSDRSTTEDNIVTLFLLDLILGKQCTFQQCKNSILLRRLFVFFSWKCRSVPEISRFSHFSIQVIMYTVKIKLQEEINSVIILNVWFTTSKHMFPFLLFCAL